MATKTKASAIAMFEKRLVFISRVYAFVGPIGILATCAALEFFTANYYTPERKRLMLPVLIIVFIMLGARVILPRISRARLGFEYGLITLMATLAYCYLLQFPSPYIVAGFVFAVLIYFDFGTKWAALSLVIQYGGVFAVALSKDLPAEQMIDIVAYTLAPMAIAVFVIRLMSLAREEVESLEKQYVRATNNAEQTLSLINNISDGVIAVDENMKIFLYNAAALDVLDINTEIRGKKLQNVFKPVDAEKQAVNVQNLLKDVTMPVTNRNLQLGYQDGSYSNLFIGMSPINQGYGKSQKSGHTILLRDITREKSLEDERNEFISVVSHELRTPIAITEGVISNAEFLNEKTDDKATVTSSLAEAHKQVLFLADMVNDLSTLSRAERGVLEVDTESINVAELCEELRKNYSKSATDKGLKLLVKANTNVGALLSSKLYVREILQNFITNAIKYTEQGSVTIIAESGKDGINFKIRDTGIGIGKADQDKVFDKFFRSEDFRTRRNNGTGLGLYVTMKLMHLIHAEVSIQSEIDKGTTFTVFIPNFTDDMRPRSIKNE